MCKNFPSKQREVQTSFRHNAMLVLSTLCQHHQKTSGPMSFSKFCSLLFNSIKSPSQHTQPSGKRRRERRDSKRNTNHLHVAIMLFLHASNPTLTTASLPECRASPISTHCCPAYAPNHSESYNYKFKTSLSSSLKTKDNENFVKPKTQQTPTRPIPILVSYEAIAKSQANHLARQRIQFQNTLSDDYSAKKKALTSTINDIWKLDRKLGHNHQNGKTDTQQSSKVENGNGKTKTPKKAQITSTFRKLWRRRHARSIEEGIRRERISGKGQTLSEILEEHQVFAKENLEKPKSKRKFGARTIGGLIKALAEEATGLEVEVDARNDTPLWGKHVDELRINFDRLAFRQLRMGGLEDAIYDTENNLSPFDKENIAESLIETTKEREGDNRLTNSPYEVFDRIDTDNSGALDEEELARALSFASGVSVDTDGKKNSMDVLGRLASRLVRLYDTNGDGVVDREEYKKLVQDMTVLRSEQRLKQKEREAQTQSRVGANARSNPQQWKRMASNAVLRLSKLVKNDEMEKGQPTPDSHIVKNQSLEDISDDASITNTVTKGEGSIVFSDLKVDLRRLLFGSFPIIKKVRSFC